MFIKRNKSFCPIATIMVILLLCFFSLNVGAKTINGKVINVSDGDTVKILDKSLVTHRVRLSGIDAPEKAQPFGQRSKEQLAKTLNGKQVEAQCGKPDRYGRAVCKVLLYGKDVNLEQIRAGLAWHYKAYASEQTAEDRNVYSMAEERARADRLRMWRNGEQMPPWEWRRNSKKVAISTSTTSSCLCSSETYCTGSKGGQYCMSAGGNKRYK